MTSSHWSGFKCVVAWTVLGLVSIAPTARAAEPAKALRLDFKPSIVEARARNADAGHHTLQCRRMSEAPTIDGGIGTQEWKEATEILTLGPGAPATRVYVGFDDQNFYFAGIFYMPDDKKPKGTKYELNTGAPWQDDSVELFFAVPNGDKTVQYQFVVNAASSMFGISSEVFAGDKRSDFKSPWKGVATIDGVRWIAEISIPRSTLGLENWPAQLAFNMGRSSPLIANPHVWTSQWGFGEMGLLTLQGVPDVAGTRARQVEAAKSEGQQTGSTGKGIGLHFPTTSARPQTRWLRGEMQLAPSVALDKTRVWVEVVPLGGGQPLDTLEVVPTATRGVLDVDVRQTDQPAVQVIARLLVDGKPEGLVQTLLTREDVPALGADLVIPLLVNAAPQTGVLKQWPATFGVPIPAGALWDASGVCVADAQGKAIPAQVEVTGRWGVEGSIKWLRVDTLLDSDQAYSVRLTKPEASRPAPKTAVTVKRDGDHGAVIDTGAARYVIGVGASPIKEIWLGGQKVAMGDIERGLYVTDQTGRVASANDPEQTVTIESAGPVAASVKIEGFYRTAEGEPLARHSTRLETFAGQKAVRIYHTMVFTQDTNKVWFAETGWSFTPAAGAEAQTKALFGIDRESPQASTTVPLAGKTSAFIVQDSHFRFGAGENHFYVATSEPNGQQARVKEGQECGDWTALLGGQAGLLFGCRETARQHPKEFEATPNRLTMKLFSSRTSEQLDFRSPMLMKKWNLEKWLPLSEYIILAHQGQTVDGAMAAMRDLPSNAQGWAKTHELVLAPLATQTAAADAAQIAGAMTYPFYVQTDPKWIYRTLALGPVHPRDVGRFPEAEETVAAVFDMWDHRDDTAGLFGYMDFNSGPFNHPARGDNRMPDIGRWKILYNIRRDLLYMSARSGERTIRNLAEACARAVCDNSFVHWPGENRTLGAYYHGTGADGVLAGQVSLPYLWDGRSTFDTGATSEPTSLMYLYYMTGYRRAKETADGFFAALKATWSPRFMRNQYFGLRILHNVALGAEFTQDREMEDMTLATVASWHDPESPLLLNFVTLSPSYKIQQDLHGVNDIYDITGDARVHQWLLARHWNHFDSRLGYLDRYQSNQGINYAFLYRETGSAFIAEEANTFLRQLGTFYDPATKKIVNIRDIPIGSARIGSMNGLLFAEDAVARADSDHHLVASWAGAEYWAQERPATPGVEGTIIVKKAFQQSLTLRMISEGVSSAGQVKIRGIDVPADGSTWATDLNHVQFNVGSEVTTVQIEKYAPPGSYEISGGQRQYVLADRVTPMVVHAPGPWIPYPDCRPFAPIYFKLPSDSNASSIRFEQPTMLFDPQGHGYPSTEAVTGEIKLPADRPGLWHFIPVKRGKVEVTNVPPYFAFRDPNLYFDPPKAPETPPAAK